MLKRAIPSTGELLPVIGLGTWEQFDVDQLPEHRAPLKQVLQQMAQHDSTLIDSSPMYARSEEVVGDLTQGKQLPAWAAENDIHDWAQFFLKFILAHPAVTCIIPGTSNPKNVVSNTEAGTGRVPDEAIRKEMIHFFNTL